MKDGKSTPLPANTDQDAIFEASLRRSRPQATSERSLERELSIALILSTSSGERKSDVDVEKLGRLIVRSRVGGGTTGIVYGAYDPNLRRNVAVKLLRADIARDNRERIAAEARALAQLNHPNVVTIYEINDDGDELYFVMEFVQGVTLGEWLDAQPEADWREICALFIQAGRGLCAAHEKGIVHGDFGGKNALVGDDGRVRVVDFGLARFELSGAPLSAESDQYSFCASLQAALRLKNVPERVQRLLRKGLHEEPAQRHANFADMIDALEVEARARRDRSDALLLERVERLWLTGVLYRSLAGHEAEPLRLRARPDLVDTPWETPGRRARVGREQVAAGRYSSTEIRGVMDDSSNALLIVGEPGAGKTTLLLQLCKELWRSASRSEDAPRPLVLNVSSYDAQKQDHEAENFKRWVEDEVVAKYGLPRSTIRGALEAASVALLLDGLDEASPANREVLVQAINAFRDTCPVPLVVSCRDSEYASIGNKLNFGGAVQIEPLGDEAVHKLMQKRGTLQRDADVVREAESGSVREALRNPLLLTLWARGVNAATFDGEPDWKSIYAHVVKSALARAAADEDVKRMEAQLRFLARTMKRLSITDLWLERIRFDWFARRGARYLAYAVGALVVFAFGFSVNMANVPLTGMPPISALTFSLTTSVGAFAYTLGKIKPVEQLRWSWKRALKVLPATTLCTSAVGLAEALRINFAANMVGAIIGGVLLALASGLEPSERPGKVSPNAGIARSLRYALGVSLAFAIPSGLFFAFVVNPYITGPLIETLEHDAPRALVIGVAIGLFAFSALFLIYGGFTFILHWVIRVFLAVRTPLPLRLTPMLDRFVELDLMRRVGGGYVFLHRTLLDYLADADEA